MQLFRKLFGSSIQFIYHSFDRVVINGYLSFFRWECNVVAFFRCLLGVPVITKEVLAKRTLEYHAWVQAYARKQAIPLEWAPPGVRKEDWVRLRLDSFRSRNKFGVYYILMSMEQGPCFRSLPPKHPTGNPNYRIIRRHRSRYRFYYFYIFDEVMGACCLRIGSFLPFPVTAYLNGHEFIARELKARGISFTKRDNCFTAVSNVKALQGAADRLSGDCIQARVERWSFIVGPKFSMKERSACDGLRRKWAVQQVEYCANIIFKTGHPIRWLFERCCELSLFLMSGERIGQVFGTRLNRRTQGKIQSIVERVDHGMHVFRTYWKHSFLKQYEKWATLLRLELVSNNVRDFKLRKGLDRWEGMRSKFQEVLDRFAHNQAQNLNVHGQFDLLSHLAKPVHLGKSKVAGIKLEQTRIMRLLEVFLRRAGGNLGQWTAAELRTAILGQFRLKEADYGLNSLRYDLRKLRAHGIIQRVPHTYGYRLTPRGQKVAILLTLFRKRIYGPISAATLGRQPDPDHLPNSPLEKAYCKVDRAVDQLITALAA